MTVVINKALTKKERDAILEKLKSEPKRFDAKKYFGKIKIKGDPLEIQREMRNE